MKVSSNGPQTQRLKLQQTKLNFRIGLSLQQHVTIIFVEEKLNL